MAKKLGIRTEDNPRTDDQLLNEDLAGEYQAIIAYTVYSQVLKGAAYTDIARELEAPALGRSWRTPSKSPSRLTIWWYAGRDAQPGQNLQ